MTFQRANFCSFPPALVVGLVASAVWGASGCAHQPRVAPQPPLSPATQALVDEARAIPVPQFEEDFNQAALRYQALPVYVTERAALRERLLTYLLAPVGALSLGNLRAHNNAHGLVHDDTETQMVESFQAAMALFAPEELWNPDGLVASTQTRAQLKKAARLIFRLYAPRADEEITTQALAVLATLEPNAPDWETQIDALLDWTEQGRQIANGRAGLAPPPSARKILQDAFNHWPSPALAQRLRTEVVQQQNELTRLLRRPPGPDANGKEGFGAFLLQSQEKSAPAGQALAALYCRAGQPSLGFEALKVVKDGPGDDPDAREKLAPFSSGDKVSADAYLALARHFLPESPALQGSATEHFDWAAGLEILRLGIRHHPKSLDLHLLMGRLARMVNAPVLSFRHMQEAVALSDRLPKDEQVVLAQELLDVDLLMLRISGNEEDVDAVTAYAKGLRSRMAETQKRFGKADWLDTKRVDFLVADTLANAGRVDDAVALYARHAPLGIEDLDTILRVATLAMKRGAVDEAILLLKDTLEKQQKSQGKQETIGFVRDRSRLANLLADAFLSSGQPEAGKRALLLAASGWERLFVEFRRQRNRHAAAESAVELAKIYYIAGRPDEAFQKFNEAIDLAEDRDKSYIDALAFLVPRGEVDAASDIFRKTISRQGGEISEYIRVYAALWVQDLTVRAGRAPEPSAAAYLHHLAQRKVHLRPMRASSWYVGLARHASGLATFADLQAQANSPGRKAELLFYEAMKQLGAGNQDRAVALWKAVLDTKMVSYFEFEMATRYLRVGAPETPQGEAKSVETI